MVTMILFRFRDKHGKSPYVVATDKETRNEFRRFMSKYPEKYDYKAANVSIKLTTIPVFDVLDISVCDLKTSWSYDVVITL